MSRCAMRVALAFVTVLSFVAACSKANPLVGKWRSTADETLLQFKNDGTMINAVEEGLRIEGRYQVVDPDTITIALGGPDAPAPPRTYHITLEGDDLTVTDDRGKNDSYRRER